MKGKILFLFLSVFVIGFFTAFSASAYADQNLKEVLDRIEAQINKPQESRTSRSFSFAISAISEESLKARKSGFFLFRHLEEMATEIGNEKEDLQKWLAQRGIFFERKVGLVLDREKNSTFGISTNFSDEVKITFLKK